MSTDWNSGYVSDIDYTYGFYRELSPTVLALAALVQGRRAPKIDTPLTYCELGCGQGLSMNILAAANPHIEFYATDFNPAQIAGARRLADEAELSNMHFYDDSFEEFNERDDLPETFDIISLHGIYSWISADNRAHILNFIKKRLKTGGLVYISYNTLPGWAAIMPLRQLLVSQSSGKVGPIAAKISEALEFSKKLSEVGADYFGANSAVGQRLEKMMPMSRNYLAHEYFNRDWTPFYFQQVADDMAGAKLTFIASSNLMDHIDLINLTQDQIAFIAAEPDPLRRQGLRDYVVNQQFRRDIFVKGAENITVKESQTAWLDCRFALASRPQDVSEKFKGRLGEMTLQTAVYPPILKGFEKGPMTLRELLQDETIGAISWSNILQAIALLVGLGHLQPCLPAKNEKKRRDSTRALNKVLINRAQYSGDIGYLSSPVTGSAVPVGRFEQMFLRSLAAGRKDPSAWAADTWETIKNQGQKVRHEGKIIESDDDNLKELTRQATEFQEKKLAILTTLQVV
ncbi:class I SAM-dependent methyltransferase [Roseibium sp.]|uniref:class I SAM-dependent methyltransferase n=1 Tax=Roseibium sp. TaxID=1936156 RepID=UPI003BA864A0